MKKTLTIAAIASAIVFGGCAVSKGDFDQLKADVQQNRAVANQANQTAQQALQLSQQNATKIDRVFGKSQYK